MIIVSMSKPFPIDQPRAPRIFAQYFFVQDPINKPGAHTPLLINPKAPRIPMCFLQLFSYVWIVFTGIHCTKCMEKNTFSDLKKLHFPYYFLYLFVKNQWFEKLTKGTALGGWSPPNNIPMSPPIKRPLR